MCVSLKMTLCHTVVIGMSDSMCYLSVSFSPGRPGTSISCCTIG